MTVGFDYSKSFIKKHEVDFMKPFLKEAHNLLTTEMDLEMSS